MYFTVFLQKLTYPCHVDGLRIPHSIPISLNLHADNRTPSWRTYIYVLALSIPDTQVVFLEGQAGRRVGQSAGLCSTFRVSVSPKSLQPVGFGRIQVSMVLVAGAWCFWLEGVFFRRKQS